MATWPKAWPLEFRRRVKLADEDNCWLWIGSRDKDGYGRFWDHNLGCTVRANRYAFETTSGPLETNFACHKCDNPSCVRPDHLFSGTNQDNQLDAKAKRAGRHTVYGEQHGLSKLKVCQVRVIKKLKGRVSGRMLATLFGVSHTSIDKIFNNETWTEV